MPWVESLQFGRLEYDAKAEIAFPQGLPGFAQERCFVLIEPDAWKPLLFLQSTVSPQLCFTTLPIRAIDPDYEIQLTAEDHKLMGDAESLLALAVLCNGEGGALTANLLAPIAIHLAKRVGLQAIRWDTKYSHAQALGEVTSCS